MVQSFIENLLSGSTNRVLFETLWSLSITKSCILKNSKVRLQEQSIEAICNKIIEKIRNERPDRQNFYFSTQIGFGTIVLYRMQVDKLFNQARFAVQASKTIFADINWLSSFTKTSKRDEDSDSDYENENRKGQKKKPKNPERKRQPLSEIDLLESFFSIPDEPESKGKKGTFKELDPTIMRTQQITIIDSVQINLPVTPEDNFGEIDANGFGFDFDFTSNYQILNNKQHQTETEFQVNSFRQLTQDESLVGSPELLRRENSIVQPDIPEISLSVDISNILKNQMKTRKRRNSLSPDLSHRLGPKEPKLNEEQQDLIEFSQHNSNVSNISPFDVNANVDEIVNSTFAVQVGQKADVPFILPDDSVIPSPISINKSHKKKKTLIMDKQIKLKEEVLKSNMQNYVNKFTIKPPMQTFDENYEQIKREHQNLFLLPGTRLIISPKELLMTFNRNLQRIPKRLLKRKLDQIEESQSEEASPPKLRCRKSMETSLGQNQSIYADIQTEVLQTEDANNSLHIPPLDCHLGIQQLDCHLGIQQLDCHLGIQQLDCHKRRSRWSVYSQNEKLSNQEIMVQLKVFWKAKEPITMPKLAKNTNRFVAAGMFFELMVMAKTGVVELVQDDNLHICNILPVKK